VGQLKNLALLSFAVLLLAGPACAQTVNLQLMNEGPGNQIGGDYTYPYNFSINSSASFTPLLCDSFDRTTSNGESWAANVYPLTSPLTAFGQSSQIPGYTPAQVYEAAAIIYTEILNNTVPGANGNPALASAYGNLAIWALFDGGAQNSGYDPAIEVPIMTNALNSIGQYGSAFYAQFSVYTPLDLSQNGPQEFIGYSPAGPPSPSITFLGGGTSSLFQELAQAAVNLNAGSGPACIWTQAAGTSVLARDNRTSPSTDEQGNIWVVWSPGAGTCAAPTGSFNVYSYMSLDSVVADRCFFEVDSSGTPGCVQVMTVAPNAAGANLLPLGDTPGGIPSLVINALNGQRFFVAGTDVRPEDAQFAVQRTLAPCNQYLPRQYFNNASYYLFGLGYQTGSNVGTTIQGNASYGGGTFNVVNFNITGNDPITNLAVPTYQVSTVGAQPIVVAIAPATDSQVAAMTDIPSSTLSMFYEGILGRTTDLLGPSASGAEAVAVLVPEPASGTYSTFEYSMPQSTQFHAGQDYANCNAGGTTLSNPMALQNGAGQFGDASQRVRVIGTENMTASLQAACPGLARLGYFFWSASNAKGLTNVKYLTVNGIDPLYDQTAPAYQYTGVLPNSGATGDPGLTGVNFAMVNGGDYPIWSALRIISQTPVPSGVSSMLNAVASLSQHDYIPVANLNVWHSHFYINGQNIPTPANGSSVGSTTLCAGGAPEAGGDAGGSTLLITNNANFCHDFGVTTGKLNLTQ